MIATGIAPMMMPAVASLRLAGSRWSATPPRMIATTEPTGTNPAITDTMLTTRLRMPKVWSRAVVGAETVASVRWWRQGL